MTKARTLADNFAADINAITASTPLTGGGTSGTVTVSIQDGTTSQKGAVQLEDSTASTSTTKASTPSSVKSAYDLANGAIAKSLVDAKGDLLVGSANDTVSRLTVASTAGYLLSVDSAEATGLKWAAPAAGGGMTLLSENNLSGVQDLQLTGLFAGSYKQIVIIGRNMVSTPNDSFLQLRVRETSGTIDSRYRGTSSDGSTVTAFGVNGDGYLTIINSGQNDNYSTFFTWTFYQPIGEAYSHSTLFVIGNGGYAIHSVNDHQQGIPGTVNIKNSLGNYSRGTVYVYGIK